MDNSNISLNFLEISPKKFDVKFYYRKLDEIPKDQQKTYYIRTLRFGNIGDKFEKLAIVFNPEYGLQEKVCLQNFNFDLTKQFLFNELLKKCVGSGIFKTNKDKYHRIHFSINQHEEGTETIWIESYFLSKTNSFGLLLDFKFFVSDEYKKTIVWPVDKRILKLSGTLDATGKSNKEFYIFKHDKVNIFLSKFYHIVNKFGYNFDFTVSNKLTTLSSFLLNSRTYQFENEKENKSPYFGLQSNPPLQKTPVDTNFIFVFRDNRVICVWLWDT